VLLLFPGEFLQFAMPLANKVSPLHPTDIALLPFPPPFAFAVAFKDARSNPALAASTAACAAWSSVSGVSGITVSHIILLFLQLLTISDVLHVFSHYGANKMVRCN
jgi:hypothetical protein